MAEQTRKIPLRLTSQQLALLEQVRQEGEFGRTMEELLVNMFRAFAKQQLGSEAAR
jgi:Fe2+ or Zn2+ uptake regulation protein